MTISTRKPSTIDLASALDGRSAVTDVQVADLYARMTEADYYRPERLEARDFHRGEVSMLLSAGVFLTDHQRAAALQSVVERMLGRHSAWELR